MYNETDLFTFSYPEEIEVIRLPRIDLISDDRAVFKMLMAGEYLEFREYDKNTWIYSVRDISHNTVPVGYGYHYYTNGSGFFLYRSEHKQEVIRKAWDYFYPQRILNRPPADIKDVIKNITFTPDQLS